MDTKPEIISNMPALLESSVSSRKNCLAFCQSTQILMVCKLSQTLFQTGWHERDCGSIQSKAEKNCMQRYGPCSSFGKGSSIDEPGLPLVS